MTAAKCLDRRSAKCKAVGFVVRFRENPAPILIALEYKTKEMLAKAH